uniref:Frizzled-6 n=1 Tax=Anas platyrhynchos TaxID=8839 RepID=A0A8B9QT31_ANAPL
MLPMSPLPHASPGAGSPGAAPPCQARHGGVAGGELRGRGTAAARPPWPGGAPGRKRRRRRRKEGAPGARPGRVGAAAPREPRLRGRPPGPAPRPPLRAPLPRAGLGTERRAGALGAAGRGPAGSEQGGSRGEALGDGAVAAASARRRGRCECRTQRPQPCARSGELGKMGALLGALTCAWLLALVRGHSLFTCEPITIARCSRMPYNMTFFPNIMGHYDQDTAALQMEPFLTLMNLHCSPDVHTFLCKAFVPACLEQVHVIHPCRNLCEKVYSDCKPLIDTFGIAWPEELECNRLVDCDETAPATAPVTTNAHGTQKTPGQTRRDYGFWCPRHLHTSNGQGYKFLGIDQCAPPCPNMYFKNYELDVAKSFIGIVSIFCLCATLFTFLTFLIDVKRFRYPERPIIYYSVCYSIVSLMYFIGFLLGNRTACNKADDKLEIGETVVLGSQNKACTVLFMVLYFFTMAGTIWWVIPHHHLVPRSRKKMELRSYRAEGYVVPCRGVGNTRLSNHYASCHEQSRRGQYQWSLLCGSLRRGCLSVLCAFAVMPLCFFRSLSSFSWYYLFKSRAASHPARWQKPREAEEVHDSNWSF